MTFLFLAVACLAVVLTCGCGTRLAGGLLGLSIMFSACACPAAEISVAAIAKRQCVSGTYTTCPPVAVSAIAKRQTATPAKPAPAIVVTQPPPQYVPQGTTYYYVPQCVNGQCPVPQRRGLLRFGK